MTPEDSPRLLSEHGDADSGSVMRFPVAIGGLGGSGTRVVAMILRQLGYFLGPDLNDSCDNLSFTLLFKRPEILDCAPEEIASLVCVFRKAMEGGSAFNDAERLIVRQAAASPRLFHDRAWLEARAEAILARERLAAHGIPWGWKEPNTHLILGQLCSAIPELRYIMVVRHGLDMAFSENQNQALAWGARIVGEPFSAGPRFSLRYWCAAHRRALATASSIPGRFLFLNYDALCSGTDRGLAQVCEFLGIRMARLPDELRSMIVPPVSIGRHRRHGRNVFDPDDVAYVESLGFVV